MRVKFRAFLILGVTLLATGCGGGGGGGGNSFVGAAEVTIQASPQTIDTGDRALVTANVSDVHKSGILLKFHFPSSLRYVPNSAELVVAGSESELAPGFNVSIDNETYLVFFLGDRDFPSARSGVFRFEVQAVTKLANGEIEVDADVDDPEIANAEEFNPEAPEFEAQDAARIEVIG